MSRVGGAKTPANIDLSRCHDYSPPREGVSPRPLPSDFGRVVPWPIVLCSTPQGRLAVRVRSRKRPMFMRPRTTGRLRTTKSHTHLARIFWSLGFGICLEFGIWCFGISLAAVPWFRSRPLHVTGCYAQCYGCDIKDAQCLRGLLRCYGSSPPRGGGAMFLGTPRSAVIIRFSRNRTGYEQLAPVLSSSHHKRKSR